MSRKQTIIDIFNEMNFKEENSKDSVPEGNAVGDLVLQKGSDNKELTSLSVNDIIDISVKAQETWKASLIKTRAKILHKIGKILLQNKFFKEGAEYFEYYSDLLIIREKQFFEESNQVILLILPQDFPPFIFCSAVAGAFAHGSSVIVQSSNPEVVGFQKAIENSGLPTGLFTATSHSPSLFFESASKKINNVIFFGDVLPGQPLCTVSGSFNYICPHNTSAIFLDSCDLSAAINKVLMETWGQSSSMWGVSTLIVQESIYKKFVEKLKIQFENFCVHTKYTVKFKNSADIFKGALEKAEKGGGQIIQQAVEHGWSPTAILQCQEQNIESDLLILKVMTCRTAAEGVSLLNNTRVGLGVSIWTEISSEALEVAAELKFLNIWVNCHGCFSADKPLRPLNRSGNFICGGVDGMMQFADVRQMKPNLKKQDEESFKTPDPSSSQHLNSSIQSSFLASQSWRRNSKRKLILKQIADFFESKKDQILSEIINFYSHSETFSDYCENFCERKFFTVQHPVPVGVIALIVASSDIDAMISLLTPSLVLGNSVVVVLKENHADLLDVLEIFRSSLPMNVLQVFVGEESAEFLTSDPTIQEFWLRDDTNQSEEFLEKIALLLNSNLKRHWMTPKFIPKSFPLFWRKCLQQKIIWLPKVDKFP